ncbi:MAG: hypothetical protein ACLR8P_04175 [Clostridium fessum]
MDAIDRAMHPRSVKMTRKPIDHELWIPMMNMELKMHSAFGSMNANVPAHTSPARTS